MSLWEVPPGETAYPYHFHLAEEEVLVVLNGAPLLRDPDVDYWDRENPPAFLHASREPSPESHARIQSSWPVDDENTAAVCVDDPSEPPAMSRLWCRYQSLWNSSLGSYRRFARRNSENCG